MTESSWIIALEATLLLATLVGACVSAVLTADSWIRYLRVRAILDGNYFPRMHLRVDLTLLIVQFALGSISILWFVHLLEREGTVLLAVRHIWPVFPIRLFIVLLLTICQSWNAWDRHKMHFGEHPIADRRVSGHPMPEK